MRNTDALFIEKENGRAHSVHDCVESFLFIGAVKRMNVCTRCLRSGNVQRAVPKTHTDEVGA